MNHALQNYTIHIIRPTTSFLLILKKNSSEGYQFESKDLINSSVPKKSMTCSSGNKDIEL